MRVVVVAAVVWRPHLSARSSASIDVDAHKHIGTHGNGPINTLLETHVLVARASQIRSHTCVGAQFVIAGTRN